MGSMTCHSQNPLKNPAIGGIITYNMKYTISYFKADGTFAYADTKFYTSADNAAVRAVLHLSHHSDEIQGAAIIYQGKTAAKRVRSLRVWNHAPSHK